MWIDRRLVQNFDWVLLGLGLAIPLLGLVVLYSAGYDADAVGQLLWPTAFELKSQVFVKQAIYLGVGAAGLALVLLMPPGWLGRYAFVIYGATLLLLVYVLFAGTVVNGSRRWINFGSFNMQPSEPMKIAMILAMARFITRRPPKAGGYDFVDLIFPGMLMLVPMALVMRQPDLGTALSIGAVSSAMLLFAGIRRRVLVAAALVFLVASPIAWEMMHDYQRQRIILLFDPDSDPQGTGYHINQSKIAVGSGGFLGKGFLEGTQTQLEFLPEHSTDFVFSVLAEEWGFFGCFVVLGVYFFFVARLLQLVSTCKDIFQIFVCFGFASLIGFHTVVNSGMVVGIMPVVGITLPMFSYGGSSLITMLIGLGIVLGVGMRRFAFTAR
jgi:rod shape determining protein RodA